MNDAWLSSDGAILGKRAAEPHEKGVQWTVPMPDGKPVSAVIEKPNAEAAIQFCNFVRETWNERKEEQAAKARSRSAVNTDGPRPSSKPSPAKDAVPAPEEAVVGGIPDREAVNGRILELDARIAADTRERTILQGIKGVLDELEDVSPERESISGA